MEIAVQSPRATAGSYRILVAMSDNYTSLLAHCVLSTYEGRPIIPREMQSRLWAYMGGIARAYKMKALAVGGIEDHVHLLLSLPTTITVAKAIQVIKANSSKWMNEHGGRGMFSWQRSCGAFTISVSQVKPTVGYVQNQGAPHAKTTCEEQCNARLRRQG